MNTSQKCNCCAHTDVCSVQGIYIADCNTINNVTKDSVVTECSVRCKYFLAKQKTVREA